MIRDGATQSASYGSERKGCASGASATGTSCLGYIVPGVDCHHIIPFESAKTQAEMERLCYDATGNVVLLCIPCHVKAHVELRSKTKEKVKARRSEAFERWKDAIKRGQSDAGISSAEHEHPRMECKSRLKGSRLKGDQKPDDSTTETPGI